MRSHVPASERVTSVAGVTPLRGGVAHILDIIGGTVPGFHLPPERERKEVIHVAGVIAGAGLIGLPSRAGWDVACLISALMLRTHVKKSACVLVHGGLQFPSAGYLEGVRREHLTHVTETRCC